MAPNQNTAATPVIMDSRKFLGALNSSAQSKVAFFEHKVQEMGQKSGKKWRLAALRASDLFIEDIETSNYYMAEHMTDRGNVTIQNIRPVQIKEGEKNQIFSDACIRLVNSIEENDQKGMLAAFNNMKGHRFSGRSVPYSGMVRGKDNVVRRVVVATDNSLGEETRGRLIGAIVEGLRDQVIVEDGRIVSARFNDGDPVRLPVSRWAARKLVAKKMKSAAENAYWSEGFQKRVLTIANLIAEGKIEEAVRAISPFLNEMEEFTLLTRAKTQTLIENALAARGIFNQQLCDDAATLFYRTNLRINKKKIVQEWRNIARCAEHVILAENVQILSESKSFEAAYDKFLELIFEAIANREVAAEALATTLEVLKNKTPKIRESHDLSSKLDNLINRLKGQDMDDAAIYEAEDLIATIQEELAANDALGNFDEMPGGGGAEDDLLGDLGAETMAPPGGEGEGESAPVININSPLIQIGGTSSAAGGGEEPELPEPAGDEELGMDELGGEDEGLGDDDELADLLGGGAGGGLGGAGGAGAGLGGGGGIGIEGKKRGRAIVESDDDDPYGFRSDEAIAESNLISNYGAPVISDQAELQRVVRIMRQLAKEYKLVGEGLRRNLEPLAEASIKAIGLRIPGPRMGAALDQAISLFNEWEKPWLKKDDEEECVEGDDDCDEEEEEVAEDQFKGPRIRGRGFKKTSYAPRELKNESIRWGESQEDAIMGSVGNVNFIFDHGGADTTVEPVILSEDGAIEIPIPEELHHDAFASAGMTEGGVPGRFAKWVLAHREQLRPLTADEDRALEEAVATITTTPDGGLSVEVSDEVDVNEMGADPEGGLEPDGELEQGDEFGGLGEPEDSDGEGMEPVDTVVPDSEVEVGSSDDTMPDFEGGSVPQGSVPQGGPPEEGPPEEEEEPQFEDKDVTEPSSAKYTKHVKDNLRDMPEHKPTKKTDDNLDEIGPSLKKDDGTGTKPPTAKSMSQK